MKQNQYSHRNNEIAREKLASILLFELSDPDLTLVTLTGVEVSVDRSVMRAYVSCERDRYETVSAALERAKGRIRSLLLDAGYPAVDHPDDAPNHASAFDVRVADGQVPDGRRGGIAHYEAEQSDAKGIGAVDGQI